MLRYLPVAFLICPGRAGGGFVQSILDSHPQILMLPMELKFHIQWERACEGRNLDLEEMVDFWTTKTKITHFKKGVLYGIQAETESFSNCDFKEYQDFFTDILKRDGLSKLDVFYALHEAYAKAIGQDLKNIRMLIEFPGRTHMLDKICAEFPNSKFIEIVRDPRANFMSLKNEILRSNGNFVQRRGVFYSNLLVRIIKDLKIDYEHIVNFRFAGNKDKWFMVRNEELHLNYGITVDKLAKWLKISFNPSLNESTLGGRPWLGNSSTGKPVRGASLEVVNRWRSEMLPNEKIMIEYLFRKHILRYSYNSLSKEVFTFRTLLQPIKGEFSIMKQVHKPQSFIMSYLWNFNPSFVITMRKFIRIDKLLLIPLFYIQSRIWLIRYMNKNSN